MRIPKRLLTWLYIVGVAFIVLLVVLIKPAGSDAWSSEHEFLVAHCDGYEVWTKAVSNWKRTQFFSREDQSLRVTDLLEDWDATYYNSAAPDTRIRHLSTGIGDNLELTQWLVDGKVVRTEAKGNPFRVAIPDIGALVLTARDDDGSGWTRFDVVPEGDTAPALCEALSG